MGKKKRMFIDKIVGKKGNVCEVCGDTIKQVKIIEAYKHEAGAWRYENKMKPLCSCNKDKIFH